ncbi:MAG: hypothetical protein AAF960_07775 [Bacteroidota bacterium]
MNLAPKINLALEGLRPTINRQIAAMVKDRGLDPLNVQLSESPLSQRQIGDCFLKAKIRYDTFRIAGLGNLRIVKMSIPLTPKINFNNQTTTLALLIELDKGGHAADGLTAIMNLRFLAEAQLKNQNATYRLRLGTSILPQASMTKIQVSVIFDVAFKLRLSIDTIVLNKIELKYDKIQVKIGQLGPFAPYVNEIIERLLQVVQQRIKGTLEGVIRRELAALINNLSV